MSTGELQADASAEKKGKRRGRSLSRYRTPLWLLALALVLGGLAYHLYPKDAPVAGSEAVQGIAVFANFTPSAIVANQTPEPQVNGFSLQIVVHAGQEFAAPTGTITIALPGRAWGSYVRCPAPAYYCTHDRAGLKDVSYHLPPTWFNAGNNEPAPDQYELRMTITVPHVGSNLSRNAEYVSVLTPPISFEQLAMNYPYVQVQSVYAERVPTNTYTWSTGTVPDYVDGFDRWTSTSAGALQDAASPTLDSGTDLAVQAHDGNFQFIAGIVVGCAGGALVGALQEFLDGRKEAREEARTDSV